jgi:uncharacterized protein (DUF1501 family)
MNRKDFIKASGLSAAALAVNGMPIKALADTKNQMKKIRGASDRVFVFVVLSGGNDGLNTIIPLDKYAEIASSRANVMIPQSSVLSLTGTTTTGMHPAMSSLRNMYNNGQINIVQSAGYTDFNYSHFRATDIYNSASDSNQIVDSGWVGRYLSKVFPGAPNAFPSADFLDPLAIEIGNSLSTMLNGPAGQIGFALDNINNFYQIVNGAVDPAPNTPAGHELTFIRYISLQTQAYTQVVQNAAAVGTNTVTYPTNNRLAKQLEIVAHLISGGLKTPIYIVELGGFDTHSDQVDGGNTTTGDHATLLNKVSEAISTFYQDLKNQNLDGRVAGCTVTEFGRRIKSNASTGTDHGAGVPMISFGTNVIPGIIGNSPNLPMNATVEDQIPMQYDFRQVYASILEDWFGLSAADTADVLNGQTYTKLPIFKALPTEIEPIGVAPQALKQVSIYPNPMQSHTSLQFDSPGGYTHIALYTDAGRQIKILYEQETLKGLVNINIDRGALAPGIYYVQIYVDSQSNTAKLLVR